MRLMRYVNGFKAVFDHPLAFMSKDKARRLREGAARDRIPGLATLPSDAKVIGVFVFLSEYKGFDAVIKAMHLLPPNYHLLICGGVHPNDIKPWIKVHPYVQALLDEAYFGVSALKSIPRGGISLQLDNLDSILPNGHPRNIGARIHFLGAQSDEGFATTMACCDCVVLLYLEVGQSSSGVLSVALEMKTRVIAARNHAFVQFTRYHPKAIELFDVGNYLELAEKLMAEPSFPIEDRVTVLDVTTNARMYVEAHANVPSTVKSMELSLARQRG